MKFIDVVYWSGLLECSNSPDVCSLGLYAVGNVCGGGKHIAKKMKSVFAYSKANEQGCMFLGVSFVKYHEAHFSGE